MSQSEVVRNIKIKTNTLKRLHKELSYYQQEKNKEEARVEQMRSQQADAHDLRQAVSWCGWVQHVESCHQGSAHASAQLLRGAPTCQHILQENVAAESAMMVPETRQRLEAALSELQSYLVRVQATVHAQHGVHMHDLVCASQCM